jgi:hypothetical protein
MNDTIKRRMKTTYNLIDHMKKYERYDYDMLMSCLSNLEHVYDEIFADRERLSDTIDKPMS